MKGQGAMRALQCAITLQRCKRAIGVKAGQQESEFKGSIRRVEYGGGREYGSFGGNVKR